MYREMSESTASACEEGNKVLVRRRSRSEYMMIYMYQKRDAEETSGTPLLWVLLLGQ